MDDLNIPIEMQPVPRYTRAELEYLEMTPRQLADFQASPRPLPGTVTAGWVVAIVATMVVMWRVLARMGYFV